MAILTVQVHTPKQGEFQPFAKGRNGYYHLDRMVVEGLRTDSDPEVLELSVMAFSKRSTYPGPGYFTTTAQQARQIAFAILEVTERMGVNTPREG